jgi:hypothetical protein
MEEREFVMAAPDWSQCHRPLSLIRLHVCQSMRILFGYGVPAPLLTNGKACVKHTPIA